MLRSETAAKPDRFVAALAGLHAYQQAERQPPPPAMPVDRRVGRARLLRYGCAGASRRAVVFVPSLINPPDVLDMAPDQSLLRWIATQGLDPYLVDWGDPTAADRDLDITAHVDTLLRPLIEGFAVPPVLVGYCLGGTMALAAAAIARVHGLATIAAPWRFSGYGGALATMSALWAQAQPGCEALGLVPMEVLQAGFWQLDPARTIAKYEAFGRMEPGSAPARAFVRLEDWANAGAPLTYAAGAALFDEMIERDLPGRGEWRIGGRTISPAALSCPSIEFVSLTDRIVPAATAAGLADRRDLSIGHVGMIVGSRARDQLWQPLADWITALG